MSFILSFSFEQICRHAQFAFQYGFPIQVLNRVFCPFMTMVAQLNHGCWKGKVDLKQKGGNFPPVLHSFLDNIVKEKAKRTNILQTPQFPLWLFRAVDCSRGQLLQSCWLLRQRHCHPLTCILLFSFCLNISSGFYYSLNTGSLKANNSPNWLV